MLGRDGENLVRRQAHHIGDEHFFTKTNDDAINALGKTRNINAAMGDLGGDVFVADDGTGHQLGEKRNIQRRVGQRHLGRRLTAIDVHQIGYAVECKKGYADRQMHLSNSYGRQAAGLEQ